MDQTMKVWQARESFWQKIKFTGDKGGRTAKWARLKIGPFLLPFPNIAARRRVIPMHDLHHVATGYQPTIEGEAEIAAWEIGGGLGGFWVAWFFDLLAFSYGLLLCPVKMYRAFARGRHCRTFYRLGEFHEENYLHMSLYQLRVFLGIPKAKPQFKDFLIFMGLGLLVGLLWLSPVLLYLLLLR